MSGFYPDLSGYWQAFVPIFELLRMPMHQGRNTPDFSPEILLIFFDTRHALVKNSLKYLQGVNKDLRW